MKLGSSDGVSLSHTPERAVEDVARLDGAAGAARRVGLHRRARCSRRRACCSRRRACCSRRRACCSRRRVLVAQHGEGAARRRPLWMRCCSLRKVPLPQHKRSASCLEDPKNQMLSAQLSHAPGKTFRTNLLEQHCASNLSVHLDQHARCSFLRSFTAQGWAHTRVWCQRAH